MFLDDNLIDQEISEYGVSFLDYKSGGDNPDGGYRDICNSLIYQIKQVEKMYQDQLAGLRFRQRNLRDSISLDIKVSAIWLVAYLGVWGLKKICEHNMLGIVSLGIYMFIKILFPAMTLVIFGFIFPAYFKSLYVNIRNYQIMNESFADEKVNGNIVTFVQEERFLKDELYKIRMALEDHKKVEAEMAEGIDEEWNHRMEKDVERLREVSRFRQYYAEGLKKESAVKQAWMPTVVFIILGIVFIFLLFS